MEVQMSEGTETVAVGVEDKRVVLKFPKPISWAALDPDTALAVGEEMARSAYTVKYGKAPSQGSTLSREIRNAIITRTMHVIRSTQAQKKSARYVAEAVVDTVLSQVL